MGLRRPQLEAVRQHPYEIRGLLLKCLQELMPSRGTCRDRGGRRQRELVDIETHATW